MSKICRLLAICSLGVVFATSSIVWAQHYTQIDYPGAIATALIGGPNPQGTSVGIWTDPSSVVHGFTLTSHGVFTSFDPPGSTFTDPTFISPEGMVTGQYLDASNVSHGFVLYRGQYTIVDAPGWAGTSLSAINPSGEMAGFVCKDAACATFCSTYESFTVSKKGEFTFFNPPSTFSRCGSFASVVNPSGAVGGAYYAYNGTYLVLHGYLLYHGTYTTIDYPGVTVTFCGGLNAGDIVGQYDDADGVAHSFLLSHGVFTSFDPPGAANFNSAATGINNTGIIVGVFVDADGNQHGYIRTP
jgi:hypothetical protein